jgi:hypothetical protein
MLDTGESTSVSVEYFCLRVYEDYSEPIEINNVKHLQRPDMLRNVYCVTLKDEICKLYLNVSFYLTEVHYVPYKDQPVNIA